MGPGLADMQEPDIHVTGYIPVPPETVWEVFSDLDRWEKLDPAAGGRIPLDPGDWRPGFRVRVRLKPRRLPHFSRAFVMHTVVPARHMTWSAWAIPGLIGLEIEHTFAPTGNGTRFAFDLRRRGPLGRLMLFLLGRSQYEELVTLGRNLGREAMELAGPGLFDGGPPSLPRPTPIEAVRQPV